MLTQTKDLGLGQVDFTSPPHKLKSDPFPKQSQDQSLFQAEHFRPKSCWVIANFVDEVFCLRIVAFWPTPGDDSSP